MEAKRLFGTTWKSPVSISWVKQAESSTREFHCTCSCIFFYIGKLSIKIWKPKFLRCLGH